eukprot:4075106-Prymnesium_polylepis.1
MGAFDGITHSNTFMLERCLSWRGSLIEASPTNYRLLATSPRNVTKRHTQLSAPSGEQSPLISSKCNEFATRFRIRFAAASRLSRAVSRLFRESRT